MTEPIACGTHIVQEQHRVTIGKAMCEAHGIRYGDPVEVWIKPYVKEED
jgi:hypothetical protein